MSLENFIKKDSKVQNEKPQTIEKHSEESYSTKSKIGKTALILSKVFEQVIKIKGGTIEDIDLGIEQNDKRNMFFKKKNRITRFLFY